MNEKEKELLQNLFSLTSLSKTEFDSFIEFKTFEETQKEIYDILLEDAQKRPKSLLKKFCTYCIDENESFDKMVEDLKQFSLKINLQIEVDKVSYMINTNAKVSNIIANYIGNDVAYYSLNELLKLPTIKATFIETYCDINDINIVDDTLYESSVPDAIAAYLQNLPKKILTRDEERELYFRYHNGDENAKNELIHYNLRLVVSIACKYRDKGLELMDSVQNGNLGLIRAVEKFDATKGYKLSTYATWWIRQGISREIDNNARSIRIPIHMLEKIKHYKRICADFHSKYGIMPTDEEAENIMEISKEELERIKKYMDDAVSLDTPVGEVEHGEQTTLGDFIEQTSFPLPEANAINNDIRYRVFKALMDDKRIDERAVEIIKYRVGFYDKVYTLEEIGKIYGVTRERVRQVEANAYKILSKNKTIIKLAESMGIKSSNIPAIFMQSLKKNEISAENNDVFRSYYDKNRKR